MQYMYIKSLSFDLTEYVSHNFFLVQLNFFFSVLADIDVITEGEPESLLKLILAQSSGGKLSPGSEFFVVSQEHIKFLIVQEYHCIHTEKDHKNELY